MSGRTLFLIPARGGSKRIPVKNLTNLAGIPLVVWAGRIARAAAAPDDAIVCSTSGIWPARQIASPSTEK